MCAGHMEEVVSLTFQYIRVLQQQGVAEWMFEEVCHHVVGQILLSFGILCVLYHCGEQ